MKGRMSPPHRQSEARISEEVGTIVISLYKWKKVWQLQVAVVPASEKAPEVWTATDKFKVVLDQWLERHRAQRLLP